MVAPPQKAIVLVLSLSGINIMILADAKIVEIGESQNLTDTKSGGEKYS